MAPAIVFLIFLIGVDTSSTARILSIVPTPSYSHQVAFHSIWKNLSLRGHQVTLVTTDPINDPSLTNLTEIDIGFSYKHFRKDSVQAAFLNEETNIILKWLAMIDVFVEVMNDMTVEQLEHATLQNLIRNESVHFDLVMIELLQPVMLGFGKRFRCPVIGVLSLDATTAAHEAIGNPVNPALYPDWALPFEGKLTFTERLQSFIYYFVMKLLQIPFDSSVNAHLQNYFGREYAVTELMADIDMVFVNANPVLNYIRPNVPALIYFGGGSHLQIPKPLPTELQDYLDGAKQGFVYFSLGSNVKSKDIPEKLRRVIIETLSELPYKVLWKFEADELPGKPDNVKIMKWLPQQDVLRHPNIKLFITQGGLQSMEEAIFTHVPLVVMPFMGDQDTNAIKIVNRGYGLSVDRRTLTKELFKETILEVINNEKYRNRIKEIAELALDQPISGVDNAVWWTEYVLRHKGAKHLRSPAIDMPWYQYLLLDVIAFLFGVIFIVLYITYKIVKIALRLIRSSLCKSKLKTN